MTNLADLIPPLWLAHGLGMEEPKHNSQGWCLLDGKNAALGLGVAGRHNVSFQLGYYEEMADLAFIVERLR